MNEVFSQILREASERHEVLLNTLTQEVQELKGRNMNIEKLNERLGSLEQVLHVTGIKIGSIEGEERRLRGAIDGLKQELAKPLLYRHHHNVSLSMWIAAGLFLILSVVLACWYNTGEKLNEHRETDIKYRFLRLQHDRTLLLWLHKADSLHHVRPDSMRDVVETEEERHKRAYELMEQAARKEAEAKELRRRAIE